MVNEIPNIDGTAPQLPPLTSQACSFASLTSPQFLSWAERLRPYWDENLSGSPVPIHRKMWEWFFIAQALWERKMLRPGCKGLGFGVGKEPLVPLFASFGCTILATDQSAEAASEAGWKDSNQFAGDIRTLNEKHICDPATFSELVRFQTVDMRQIPSDLRDFDFTWSSCAFEHLGSIENGVEFIFEQMNCLRPGGVAVHTTEFNVSSNTETTTVGPTVLFRKRDIKQLARGLQKLGHRIVIDFTLGNTEHDLHVDCPPWSGAHLRLLEDGYVITSFGLIIEKCPSAKPLKSSNLLKQVKELVKNK